MKTTSSPGWMGENATYNVTKPLTTSFNPQPQLNTSQTAAQGEKRKRSYQTYEPTDLRSDLDDEGQPSARKQTRSQSPDHTAEQQKEDGRPVHWSMYNRRPNFPRYQFDIPAAAQDGCATSHLSAAEEKCVKLQKVYDGAKMTADKIREDLNDTEDELAMTKEKLTRSEEELTLTRSQLAEAEELMHSTRVTLRDNISELEESYRALDQAHIDQEERRDYVITERDELFDEVRQLRARPREHDAEISRLENVKTANSAILSASETDIKRLRDSENELLAKIKNMNHAIQGNKSELAEREERITGLEERIAWTEEQRTYYETEYMEALEWQTKARPRIRKLEEEIWELGDELNLSQKAAKEKDDTIKLLEHQIELAEQTKTELWAQNRELSGKVTDMEPDNVGRPTYEESQRMKDEIMSLNARVEQMGNTASQLEKNIQDSIDNIKELKEETETNEAALSNSNRTLRTELEDERLRYNDLGATFSQEMYTLTDTCSHRFGKIRDLKAKLKEQKEFTITSLQSDIQDLQAELTEKEENLVNAELRNEKNVEELIQQNERDIAEKNWEMKQLQTQLNSAYEACDQAKADLDDATFDLRQEERRRRDLKQQFQDAKQVADQQFREANEMIATLQEKATEAQCMHRPEELGYSRASSREEGEWSPSAPRSPSFSPESPTYDNNNRPSSPMYCSDERNCPCLDCAPPCLKFRPESPTFQQESPTFRPESPIHAHFASTRSHRDCNECLSVSSAAARSLREMQMDMEFDQLLEADGEGQNLYIDTSSDDNSRMSDAAVESQREMGPEIGPEMDLEFDRLLDREEEFACPSSHSSSDGDSDMSDGEAELLPNMELKSSTPDTSGRG